MLCKVLMWAGASVGWGGAVLNIAFTPFSLERGLLVSMTLLSLAIVCTAKLIVSHHQRPMAAAFNLGYEQGRRDSIREATRRAAQVPTIGQVPNGWLGEVNRRSAGA